MPGQTSLHDIGMNVIHAIGNEGFDSLSFALDKLDPEFRRLLVEGAYAGLIARPKLALKHRELITVAALATIGNAESALKYHASGMLNTGWTPQELLETVLHTLTYAGLPIALAGVRVVTQVLAERGIELEYDGRLAADDAAQPDVPLAQLLRRNDELHALLPPELREVFVNVVYGTALNRAALAPKHRQLATLAIAMARENQAAAVRLHLRTCLQLGWTRSELTEVLIQMTGHIGWPLILPVTKMALEIFEAFERQQPTSDQPPQSSATRVGQSMHDAARSLFAMPKGVADLAPALVRYVEDLGFVATEPEANEPRKARRLSDIACLTCLARSADAPVLSAHISEALALGATRQQIVDAILSALPHAGVLAAQYGLAVAVGVFEKLNERELAESVDR